MAHICQSSTGSREAKKETETGTWGRNTREGAPQDWLHCLSHSTALYTTRATLQQRTNWNFALLLLFLLSHCCCCCCCYRCCYIVLLLLFQLRLSLLFCVFVYCYSSANRPTNVANIYTNCLNNCCPSTKQRPSHPHSPSLYLHPTKIGPLFRCLLLSVNYKNNNETAIVKNNINFPMRGAVRLGNSVKNIKINTLYEIEFTQAAQQIP